MLGSFDFARINLCLYEMREALRKNLREEEEVNGTLIAGLKMS